VRAYATPTVPQFWSYPDAEETVPRFVCYDDEGMPPGEVDCHLLIPRTSRRVSTLTTASRSIAGIGMTLCRMGLYEEDPDTGDLTLLGRTADDPTLWSATATVYARALDTAGGYPASVVLRAGRLYRFATIAVGQGTNPRVNSIRAIAAAPTLGMVGVPLWRFVPGPVADLSAGYTAAQLTDYGGAIVWGAAS
jgi:hypothetical protein